MIPGTAMTRLLTFTPSSTDGCAFYRAHGVLARVPGIHISQGNTVSWSSFSNADITFMQRPYTRQHVSVAKMAKDHTPLWLDYDDLLTEVPSSNPAYFTYCSSEIQESIHTLLNLADAISVSTQALGMELAKLTDKPIWHIPNAYNDYTMPKEVNVSKNEVPTVLWRGTSSHQGDLFVYNEQLAEAIERMPDVRFVFAGYIPWMLPKNYDNVSVMPPTDLMQYLKQVDQLNPDVTLVPLEDSVFNRCKSNIAELETARSSSVVVGPSFIDWVQIENIVDYDISGSIYEALNIALWQSTTIPEYTKRSRWSDIMADRALSVVNQDRTALIKELMS